MAHLADIAFGIIIGDRTHGTRYGKKEDRYRIIGVMGLRFDGLKLVPCSLSDYKEKIANLGASINENSYLCVHGLGIAKYYGIGNNEEYYLPPLSGTLPVYDKNNNYLFTCGDSNIAEIKASYDLVLRIDTETLDYMCIIKGGRYKISKLELFFYKSSLFIIGEKNLRNFFERESDTMLVHGKCCLHENSGSSVVLPSWCEHCVFTESNSTTFLVLNKALKHIYLDIRMIGGINTICMSKDSSVELVASILYWYIHSCVKEVSLLNDKFSRLLDLVYNHYKVDKYKDVLDVCYSAEYSLEMKEVLKNVEFEFY